MKNTPTYRQARYLKSLLSDVPSGEFPKEARLQLHRIKMAMEKVMEKHQQEAIIILLLNGGVEKTTQQGEKCFTKPDVPKIESLDKEKYKIALSAHYEVINAIDNEMDILNNKQCGVEIPKVFTEKEFDALCAKVAGTDLVGCEHLLVKESKK